MDADAKTRALNPMDPHNAMGIIGDIGEIYNGCSEGRPGEASGQATFSLLQFVGTRGEGGAVAGAVRSAERASLLDGLRSLLRGCRNSFPAGTLVLLADGTTKPIEQLALGDQVKATDPEDGTTLPETVTNTFTTPDDHEFTDVVLADDSASGGVSTTLTSTQHHPYWDVSTQQWTDAAELKAGDKVRTDTGSTLTIVNVTNYATGPTTAYNLTVADLHTYYVLAGTTPVLVHNIDEGRLCDLTLGPGLKGQTAEGVSAERGDKALPHEQKIINEFGDRNGCAACGDPVSGYKDGHWTGDHNPPYKVSPNGPWTLYPHCKACSLLQGGVVNGLGRGWYDFPIFKRDIPGG
ncbi:polymorphic toxin-type HINT domain-containing protein [Kitasatospora sp. NPDC049285]|uniref:polymorphic toxin-type HINT domain-containing protein n=1 Tax=Kitasatospora sp. NPDC049285 TaxID=3157096 RepID=UPI003431101E